MKRILIVLFIFLSFVSSVYAESSLNIENIKLQYIKKSKTIIFAADISNEFPIVDNKQYCRSRKEVCSVIITLDLKGRYKKIIFIYHASRIFHGLYLVYNIKFKKNFPYYIEKRLTYSLHRINGTLVRRWIYSKKNWIFFSEISKNFATLKIYLDPYIAKAIKMVYTDNPNDILRDMQL